MKRDWCQRVPHSLSLDPEQPRRRSEGNKHGRRGWNRADCVRKPCSARKFEPNMDFGVIAFPAMTPHNSIVRSLRGTEATQYEPPRPWLERSALFWPFNQCTKPRNSRRRYVGCAFYGNELHRSLLHRQRCPDGTNASFSLSEAQDSRQHSGKGTNGRGFSASRTERGRHSPD